MVNCSHPPTHTDIAIMLYVHTSIHAIISIAHTCLTQSQDCVPLVHSLEIGSQFMDSQNAYTISRLHSFSNCLKHMKLYVYTINSKTILVLGFVSFCGFFLFFFQFCTFSFFSFFFSSLLWMCISKYVVISS